MGDPSKTLYPLTGPLSVCSLPTHLAVTLAGSIAGLLALSLALLMYWNPGRLRRTNWIFSSSGTPTCLPSYVGAHCISAAQAAGWYPRSPVVSFIRGYLPTVCPVDPSSPGLCGLEHMAYSADLPLSFSPHFTGSKRTMSQVGFSGK